MKIAIKWYNPVFNFLFVLNKSLESFFYDLFFIFVFSFVIFKIYSGQDQQETN
jgi:hypothetical protein